MFSEIAILIIIAGGISMGENRSILFSRANSENRKFTIPPKELLDASITTMLAFTYESPTKHDVPDPFSIDKPILDNTAINNHNNSLNNNTSDPASTNNDNHNNLNSSNDNFPVFHPPSSTSSSSASPNRLDRRFFTLQKSSNNNYQHNSAPIMSPAALALDVCAPLQ